MAIQSSETGTEIYWIHGFYLVGQSIAGSEQTYWYFASKFDITRIPDRIRETMILSENKGFINFYRGRANRAQNGTIDNSEGVTKEQFMFAVPPNLLNEFLPNISGKIADVRQKYQPDVPEQTPEERDAAVIGKKKSRRRHWNPIRV